MFRFWDCAVDIGGCGRCHGSHVLLNARGIGFACLSGKRTKARHLSPHKRSLNRYSVKAKPLDNDVRLAAQTAELVALGEKINREALLQRARQLSGGRECHLDVEDPLGRSRMGGMNVHLQIIFDHGSIWLARIPRETCISFDDQLSNKILLSECATLRWLESVDIPTPQLHGFGLRGGPHN